MSYCLEKIKRSKHAEVDLGFVNCPKDYIQLHFRKQVSYNDANVYVLANSPSNEELDMSEDHLKIATIQSSGWKFST